MGQKKQCLIVGNLKMNKTKEQMIDFLDEIRKVKFKDNFQIVLCVPNIYISLCTEKTEKTKIKIGAQNCHWESNGAFTGEISCEMLLSVGAKSTIIGHSERRLFFGENNLIVNKKVTHALKTGLNPIICVGENLEEYKNNIALEIISVQLKIAFSNVPHDKVLDTIIAYEPVYSIGSGTAASISHVLDVCCHIRKTIEKIYDKNISQNIRILYGGSITNKNVFEFLSQQEINGGLVGGYSLDPHKFISLVKEAEKI